MALAAGSKLGPYEILAPIGAGGMGEVYRARDPRMGREVAIKVAAERFSDRFSREVHAVAALNHPNICHLYDVGANYLVMELVEGPTLAERIKQGAILLDEALRIAEQIAEALGVAHEKGIVHRDLKPANIKIRPDGMVKVLDFGLAKIPPPEAGATSENSPTLTLDAATRFGVILGTAAHMSPEQARGKSVDKRADIWAFGVVFYEMLAGRRLFDGEDVSEILAKVIQAEPRWDGIPARVRRLLKKCLEKDPKKRLRDIGDVWELLEEPATAPSQSRLSWVFLAVAGLLALALAGLALVHFREQPPAPEITRFQIPLPVNENFPAPLAPQEVSPDGRRLAFAAAGADGKTHVWIRSFDSLDARMLPGIETSPSPASLFWSPDSRFLAFRSADQKLKKVDVSGGPAQTLCDSGTFVGGSWSREGVILFGDAPRGVMRVSEAGGTPTAVTTPDTARQERGHVFPKFLPDGRHFLYFHDSTMPGSSGIFVGDIDAKPSQQSTKPLLLDDTYFEYYVPSGNSGSGHLLFNREGTVLAQAFDPSKLELSGEPVPIAEEVGSGRNGGFFSASSNGVLVYVSGGAAGNIKLTWFDRDEKNLGTMGEQGDLSTPALSRDGKQAAVSRSDAQTRSANLWLFDLTRGGASTRFTFDASRDAYPVFSPDGSSIVFTSYRDGPGNLYQKFTNGAKNEEPLLKSAETKYPYSWSRDGRFLLYTIQTVKAKDDIWILAMDGSKKEPMPFQVTEFSETAARFSPDGRWIAYHSDASGRVEVYVREFILGSDGKPEATGKHQISSGGGLSPYWRDDGKELIYFASDRRTVMSAEISTKPVFQSLPGKVLFQLPAAQPSPPAVAGDGKRVLAVLPVGQSGPQQFTVVQNWQAGLRK
jgi:Tol biopolymer transport system component/predicted Ser/Thr protein kinase